MSEAAHHAEPGLVAAVLGPGATLAVFAAYAVRDARRRTVLPTG